MSFILGQVKVEEVSKENRKDTDVIVLIHGWVTTKQEGHSIHKVGCKNIQKEKNEKQSNRVYLKDPKGNWNWGSYDERFANTKLAIESIIDETWCWMNYSKDWESQIKVHPCAMDSSYKENINQEPTFLAEYREDY